MNGWLYEKDPYANRLQCKKEFTIERLSMTPVFGDAMWVDAWPTAQDWPSGNLDAGALYGGPIGGMGCFAVARQGGRCPSKNATATAGQRMAGAVDLGYVDGYVELVKLDDLRKQI